ncbi:Molybdopterin converting factor, small subunit [Halorhabdus sp. SVX81]|nr:Molybdopterin converting factor, small subunit [Halorhabdus sp. SVX81]
MSWKLFATLREAAGESEIEIEIADSATVADALEVLLAKHPVVETEAVDGDELYSHISVVHDGVRVEEPLTSDREVSVNDELALLPPLSGG